MKSIFFITPNQITEKGHGGLKLTNFILKSLRRHYDLNIFPCSKTKIFDKNILAKLVLFLNTLAGFMGNNSIRNVLRYLKALRKNNYDSVFFDGSYFGLNILLTKVFFPKVKMVTVFHNIEYIFYKQGIKDNKLLFFKLLPAYLNDLISAKYSSQCIAICESDYNSLIAKGATVDLLFPDIFPDNGLLPPTNLTNCKDIGFIGSCFHGNILLLKKFAKEILAQNPDFYLHVYGFGYDEHKISDLKPYSNLIFHGEFDDEAEVICKHAVFLNSGIIRSGLQIKSLLYMKANRLILSYSPIFMLNNFSNTIKLIDEKFNLKKYMSELAELRINSKNGIYNVFVEAFSFEKILSRLR